MMREIRVAVAVVLICLSAIWFHRARPLSLNFTPAQQAIQAVVPVLNAAPPQAGSIPVEEGSREAWSLDFLSLAGNKQPTLETFVAVTAWQQAEGTTAAFNPLATSQEMPGATDFNSHHVKNYPDRQTGLLATVQTLTYDYPGYAELRAGVLQNRPDLILQGLEAGSWGTNPSDFTTAYNELLPKYASMAAQPQPQQPQPAAPAPAGPSGLKKCPYTKTMAVESTFYSQGAWGDQFGGYHLGDDFTGNEGDPVFAPYDMRILGIDRYTDPGRFGNYITAEFLHDGVFFYAGHLIDTFVQPGQTVSACTVIGTLGATDFKHTHIKLGGPGVPEPCEGLPPGWSTGCIDPIEYWTTH